MELWIARDSDGYSQTICRETNKEKTMEKASKAVFEAVIACQPTEGRQAHCIGEEEMQVMQALLQRT